MNIDLTNATDQVVSFNGSASSGTVLGFENVDASGYTGNFGAAITASASGSIITGTANVDDITLTTGKADTVKATDAIATATSVKVDTINNFAFGASNDNLTLSIGDIEALTAVTDIITGGVTSASVAAGAAGEIETIVKGTPETLDADDDVIVLTGGTYASLTAVLRDLESGGTSDITLRGADCKRCNSCYVV